MFARILALAAMAVFLSGCATTTQISGADRTALKSVVVSRDVAVPEKMTYMGPGGATHMVFGVVGALATQSSREATRDAFQKEVSSGATIDQIAYEETLAQLRQSGKFPLRDTRDAGSATLHILVEGYGFSIPNGFSSNLVPTLRMRLELKDSGGRVLWTARDYLSVLGGPVEPVAADVIRTNAAAREASWRAGAKALAAKLVATY
ncbi:hypothetical protein PMI14_00351 [Acidovorax sp. CF316]|uniref:hypothetical protein n=1 Tax=Acidovorax sp. CF316 TaxID=1144317 RepID=UPI00026BED70|nr:hypothetical protein [Acidovorax sp. CF316]EJE54721.1 hypothetical protein PMI14_00351 [Acidovorax sp. CF316]